MTFWDRAVQTAPFRGDLATFPSSSSGPQTLWVWNAGPHLSLPSQALEVNKGTSKPTVSLIFLRRVQSVCDLADRALEGPLSNTWVWVLWVTPLGHPIEWPHVLPLPRAQLARTQTWTRTSTGRARGENRGFGGRGCPPVAAHPPTPESLSGEGGRGWE